MKTVVRICFVIVALLLVTVPLVACGGSEAPPPTPEPSPTPAPSPEPEPPAPSGNQPPVITSLVATPGKVELGKTSQITCTASDPDGDILSYAWSVAGGVVVGQENVVIWEAPDTDGDFTISVTVSDGKGGTAVRLVTVAAGHPQITLVLDPIPEESGSVYATGDLSSSWLVGDNADNNGARAFFSFDLTQLILAEEIISAELTFNDGGIVGQPWKVHGIMYLEQVNYGERPLQGGDFPLDGFELARFGSELPGMVDVALPVSRQLRTPPDVRLQVRLRLGQPTDHNSNDDYIIFDGATLNVIYVK